MSYRNDYYDRRGPHHGRPPGPPWQGPGPYYQHWYPGPRPFPPPPGPRRPDCCRPGRGPWPWEY